MKTKLNAIHYHFLHWSSTPELIISLLVDWSSSLSVTPGMKQSPKCFPIPGSSTSWSNNSWVLWKYLGLSAHLPSKHCSYCFLSSKKYYNSLKGYVILIHKGSERYQKCLLSVTLEEILGKKKKTWNLKAKVSSTWGYGKTSVVKHLPSIHKALAWILRG